MLAIIIPFFKLTFFEATLQSLADQTDKRFKVYIGDDVSPEDCSALLKKFTGKFDFDYHRFENNLGGTALTKQWERCIALSNDEEWLMILGDDDVLSVNFIEEFFLQFENFVHDFNVIRFGIIKIGKDGQPFSDLYTNPIIESSKEILFLKKRSSLSEYIFTKKQVVQIGFKDFPLAWCSDILAVLEFSNLGLIYSINKAFVKVRITEFSISGNNTNLNLKSSAIFQFYYYLITKKEKKFTNQELKILLKKINKCYINDKKNLHFLYKITFIHFRKIFFKEYFKFLKNVLFNYFKKKQLNN